MCETTHFTAILTFYDAFGYSKFTRKAILTYYVFLVTYYNFANNCRVFAKLSNIMLLTLYE